MVKKYRILFYGLIVTLVVLVDIVKDLGQDTVEDTLFFGSMVFIATLFLLVSVYYIRKILLSDRLEKDAFGSIQFVQCSFMILTVSICFAWAGNLLGKHFYTDEVNDSLFAGLFLASFSLSIFVFLIEAFFDSIIKKIDLEKRLRITGEQKAIAKYQALKKQLNPHFLFNSFNSLMGLIETDSKSASAFLHKLSELYRYTLLHSEEVIVSIKKELAILETYLTLQKVRFNENVICNREIDLVDMQYMIPPMTLQLLVENAIKHNKFSKSEPLLINIYIKEKYLYVKNSYNPYNEPSKDESTGIGQLNLINQYRLIHDEVPTFKLHNEIFIAQIPLIEE